MKFRLKITLCMLCLLLSLIHIFPGEILLGQHLFEGLVAAHLVGQALHGLQGRLPFLVRQGDVVFSGQVLKGVEGHQVLLHGVLQFFPVRCV